MILYEYKGSPIYGPLTLWQGITPGGYAIVSADQTSALFCTAGVVKFSGINITQIDAGLSLSEAHTMLTDGLTKAELVALGADLGLSLSEASLKAELLAEIQTHLEGLAP
jgi:hypothetical protein